MRYFCAMKSTTDEQSASQIEGFWHAVSAGVEQEISGMSDELSGLQQRMATLKKVHILDVTLSCLVAICTLAFCLQPYVYCAGALWSVWKLYQS